MGKFDYSDFSTEDIEEAVKAGLKYVTLRGQDDRFTSNAFRAPTVIHVLSDEPDLENLVRESVLYRIKHRRSLYPTGIYSDVRRDVSSRYTKIRQENEAAFHRAREDGGLLPLTYDTWDQPGTSKVPSLVLYSERTDFKSGYKHYNLKTKYYDLVHDDPLKAPDHVRDEHVRQEVNDLLKKYDLELIALEFRSCDED